MKLSVTHNELYMFLFHGKQLILHCTIFCNTLQHFRSWSFCILGQRQFGLLTRCMLCKLLEGAKKKGFRTPKMLKGTHARSILVYKHNDLSAEDLKISCHDVCLKIGLHTSEGRLNSRASSI